MKNQKVKKIIIKVAIVLFAILLLDIIVTLTPYWQSRTITQGHYSLVKMQIKFNPNFVGRFLPSSGNLFEAYLSRKEAEWYGRSVQRYYASPLILSLSDEKMLRLLLDNGANPNLSGNTHRETPVQYAIWRNKLDALKILLDNGADPNLETLIFYPNNTPLKTAIWHDNVEAVKILLQYGADPNLKLNESDDSPIEFAIENNKTAIAEILKEYSHDHK